MPGGEGGNPATEIRVSTVGKNLRIGPFKIPENHLQIGRAWEEWLEDFEEEITYFEITDVKDKVSALKIYGGLEVKKLARNLPDPASVGEEDAYKKLKRKLINHLLPKKNKHHARYMFSKQRQEPGESVVSCAARLREKAKDCEFGDQICHRKAADSNHSGQRSNQKEHSKEVESRPIYRRSQPKGRYQPASERHER